MCWKRYFVKYLAEPMGPKWLVSADTKDSEKREKLLCVRQGDHFLPGSRKKKEKRKA